MLTKEENDLLCRVERDAAMGGIMRRHWIPACLIEEVPEPDGDPVKVRLLGENLVVFRDSDGRVGVLDELCPHRKASLVFGRNEECGLRCLYHGWKFDVDGNCVDMSSEPPGSPLMEKVKIKAYPVHEAAGFVWIWMGPRAEMPAFDLPVFAPTPDTKISIAKIIIDCNWAQILEGAIDSAHSSSLHSSDMVPARVPGAEANDTNWLRPSTDKAPRLLVQRTSFGFRYSAIRRPIKDAATKEYVRTTLFIAPYTVQIPSNNLYNIAILHIPIDDTHTAFHFIAWGGDTVPSVETWRRFLAAQVGVDVDKHFNKVRTVENNYLQDRKSMKLGNFTGIRGIPNQDIAMWETIGAIADRSDEILGASDLAIVEFRRQMVEAANIFRSGGAAIGAQQPRIPQSKLHSFEGVVDKGLDWRTLGASAEEVAFNEASAIRTTAAE
jgi:phthalate 4,5-dioxygenase oxygenase subunit